MLLRLAYIDLQEKKTADEIRKLQMMRDSWAIDDGEYECKYETVMQNYRLLIISILPPS